jgi:hypothetical protein
MITIFAILSILHGLVHLWFVTMSLHLVEVTEEMGWTGKSWLLSNHVGEGVTRALAVFLYALAALGFVVGGAGLILDQSWFRPLLVAGSAISIVAVLLYWDGVTSKLVEKGLIGLLLSVGFLIAMGLLGWPASIR